MCGSTALFGFPQLFHERHFPRMSTEIDADGWRALLESRRAQLANKTPLEHLQETGMDTHERLDGPSWKEHLESRRNLPVSGEDGAKRLASRSGAALGRPTRARQIAESLRQAQSNFAELVKGRIQPGQATEQAQPDRPRSIKVGPAALNPAPASAAKNDDRVAKHFVKKRKATSEEETGGTKAKHSRGLGA